MNKKLIVFFLLGLVFLKSEVVFAGPSASWCTYTGKKDVYSDGKCYYCYVQGVAPASTVCPSPTPTKKTILTLTPTPTKYQTSISLCPYTCVKYSCSSGYTRLTSYSCSGIDMVCCQKNTVLPTITLQPTNIPISINTPTPVPNKSLQNDCYCSSSGYWTGDGCDGWQRGKSCGMKIMPTVTPTPVPIKNINSQLPDNALSCKKDSFSCQGSKKAKCVNGLWITETVCSQGCQEVNGEFYCVEELNLILQQQLNQKMVFCQRSCEEKDIGTCVVNGQGGVDCIRRIGDDSGFTTRDCGGRWEKCCRNRAGLFCQSPLKCADLSGICIPDQSYEKAQASLETIQKNGTSLQDLQFVLQQNLGNDAEAYQDLNKLAADACGVCSGTCLYQEKEKKFICIPLSDLNRYYNKTIAVDDSSVKGELRQPCKRVWWTAGLKKVCNNEFLTCVDNICQLSEGGRNVIANNLTVATGANTEVAGMLNTNLFSSKDTLVLAGKNQFALSGCQKNNSYYFENGACWQCIDAFNKINVSVSSDFCLNKKLAESLPGNKCQAGGGYCGEKRFTCTNKGVSDCGTGFVCCDGNQYQDNKRLAGLNERCSAAAYSTETCAPGLFCWGNSNPVCRDAISLSYDRSYADPASNIEGVSKIPLIGGLIYGISAPIINVINPGTKTAAETRAKIAVDAQERTHNRAFIDTLDGTAKTLALVESLNRTEERSSQTKLESFISGESTYKFLSYLGAATSTYTQGMPLIGDNKNTTAVLGYFEGNEAVTNKNYQGPLGKIQELGERAAASTKFGFQTAFIVADVATLGFGPSLTSKAGKALEASAVKLVGDEIAEKSFKEVVEIAPSIIKEDGLKGVLAVGSNLTGKTLRLPTVWAERAVGWKLPFTTFKPVAALENGLSMVIGAPIMIPSMAIKFTPGLTKAVVNKLAPELLPVLETGLAKIGLVSDEAIVRNATEEFFQSFKGKEMETPSLNDNISQIFALAQTKGYQGDLDAFRTVLTNHQESFLAAYIKPAAADAAVADSIRTLFEHPPIELNRGNGDDQLLQAVAKNLETNGMSYDTALAQAKAVKAAMEFERKWGMELNSDQLAAFTKIAAAKEGGGRQLTLLDDEVQALAGNKTVMGGLLTDGYVTRPTTERQSFISQIRNNLQNTGKQIIDDFLIKPSSIQTTTYAGAHSLIGINYRTQIELSNLKRNEVAKIGGQFVGAGSFGRTYLIQENGEPIIAKIFTDELDGIFMTGLTDPDIIAQRNYYKEYGGNGFVQEYRGDIITERGEIIGYKQGYVANADGTPAMRLDKYIKNGGKVSQEMTDDYLIRLKQNYLATDNKPHGDLYFQDTVVGKGPLNEKNFMVVIGEDGIQRLMNIDFYSVNRNLDPNLEYQEVELRLNRLAQGLPSAPESEPVIKNIIYRKDLQPLKPVEEEPNLINELTADLLPNNQANPK